jgi:hypothetical protein
MTIKAHIRHDISYKTRVFLKPRLPGREGRRGADKPRLIFNLSTPYFGLWHRALWYDLPPAYDDGSNKHRRFVSWRNNDIIILTSVNYYT